MAQDTRHYSPHFMASLPPPSSHQPPNNSPVLHYPAASVSESQSFTGNREKVITLPMLKLCPGHSPSSNDRRK
ncbi:hypothetical protein E2C01_083875 [Portunus trituberculatus]|uniref:Uncharacterized protein n=1 Tax=Portunus trituberculatus TaxID=210409 RepID=A0A5B7J2R7_PORTR|nr:hypothetical protein [Portunus trituberculatus]